MSSFSDTVKSLGPARLAVLGTVFIGLMIFFFIVSAQVSKPNLSLLYADLSTVDSSSIAAKLEELKIPFEVSADGSQVKVPQNDIGRARMLLAEAGLPNGGSMGFELFDKQSGFGTTSFVQNINKVRALQGELSRTISTLEPIHYAKVHIVLPQRELFSRESREASASVTLKLRPSMRLRREQINGIQNLVANAIPELSARHVTIIDSQANILASGEDDGDGGLGLSGSLKTEELRLSHERRLKRSVEMLVGSIVGANKIRAQVSVDLDFDRITTSSETYDPEGQVARSIQTITEDNTERDPGKENVSVENNLPGLQGDFNVNRAPTAQNNRAEETTNFEISKTVQSTVRESGEINKISIAVLVDGTYETDAEGNKTYKPRGEKELEQITALVKSAIGFEEDRGDTIEVVNLPFAEVTVEEIVDATRLFGIQKTQLLETAEMVVVAVMGLLVILLVVKPMLSHLLMSVQTDEEGEQDPVEALLEAQANPALAAPGAGGAAAVEGGGGAGGAAAAEEEGDSLIDMQAVEGKVKASTVKKVGDIVETHPSETVSVLRNWMSQE